MLQRIRNCFGIENNNHLDNTVEIDETYIDGKNKNRYASKKIKHSQGRSILDKTPVLEILERNGKLNANVIENTQAKTLTKEIKNQVKTTAIVYTDE